MTPRTCEGCDRLVWRHPCDDVADCFCQRCPNCMELIHDGRPVGELCDECLPPETLDSDDLEAHVAAVGRQIRARQEST